MFGIPYAMHDLDNPGNVICPVCEKSVKDGEPKDFESTDGTAYAAHFFAHGVDAVGSLLAIVLEDFETVDEAREALMDSVNDDGPARFFRGTPAAYLSIEQIEAAVDAWEQPVPAAIDRAKREILADIQSGLVPVSVRSFADLHDHVDANAYGGLCEDDVSDVVFSAADRIQRAIDAWLRAAGHLGGETPSAVIREIDALATQLGLNEGNAPDGLGFVFDGVVVVNPRMDESARGTVRNPFAYYGTRTVMEWMIRAEALCE